MPRQTGEIEPFGSFILVDRLEPGGSGRLGCGAKRNDKSDHGDDQTQRRIDARIH
jgi:hypothetical protein